MVLTKELFMDLNCKELPVSVQLVQGDSARRLRFHLRADGKPLQIPQNVSAVVRYKKSDGTVGTYDTLPDGTAAYAVEGNCLTVAIAPQACVSDSLLQVTLLQGERQLSTFCVALQVMDELQGQADTENYTNLAQWLAEAGGDFSEMVDLRTGYDGRTYETAGQAVRGQIADVYTHISNGTPPIVVTAEGTAVSASDSANRPIGNLKLYVLPSQTGEGTPSPTNVRPILFAQQVSVTVTDGNETQAHTVTLPENCGGYIDWARGKFVQTHRYYTFQRLTYGNHPGYMYSDIRPLPKASGIGGYGVIGLCDRLKYVNVVDYYTAAGQIAFYANGIVRVRVDDALVNSQEEANAWLQENPISICYELATPVECDLDAVLPALTMYYPSTEVSTDADKLELTYVADTKNYIDGKLAQLETAMLAMT